ncbi:hypothetical protein FVE85_4070 [Porphyridium purpureum]|uniref:Uncharacterized protein n=1 Tax=Porphyridium purpureum TaxID=35688 RepID=A0A5J4YS78_PORPP|nr:hypothetical protein FVE85_4070 [Porphyridium purpureum]|eukprot:POR2916..scf229_5
MDMSGAAAAEVLPVDAKVDELVERVVLGCLHSSGTGALGSARQRGYLRGWEQGWLDAMREMEVMRAEDAQVGERGAEDLDTQEEEEEEEAQDADEQREWVEWFRAVRAKRGGRPPTAMSARAAAAPSLVTMRDVTVQPRPVPAHHLSQPQTTRQSQDDRRVQSTT